VEAGALHLLHAVGALVLVGGHDLLHFLRRDGEARGGGPDGVAVGVEDGGLVDVVGADQAGEIKSLVSDPGKMALRGDGVPLVYVGYRGC